MKYIIRFPSYIATLNYTPTNDHRMSFLDFRSSCDSLSALPSPLLVPLPTVTEILVYLLLHLRLFIPVWPHHQPASHQVLVPSHEIEAHRSVWWATFRNDHHRRRIPSSRRGCCRSLPYSPQLRYFSYPLDDGRTHKNSLIQPESRKYSMPFSVADERRFRVRLKHFHFAISHLPNIRPKCNYRWVTPAGGGLA